MCTIISLFLSPIQKMEHQAYISKRKYIINPDNCLFLQTSYVKKCYKKFFGCILLCAHNTHEVLKYIWMQHCELKDHYHVWPGLPKNHQHAQLFHHSCPLTEKWNIKHIFQNKYIINPGNCLFLLTSYIVLDYHFE